MISWLIRKRKITILFFLMFTLVGVLSFLQLPQREIPEFNPPIAQVMTVYPGASSEQVEQNVTDLLEENLSQMQEIASLTSVSSPGLSFVTVELEEGLDVDQVWNEVRQRVNDASAEFPDDANAPMFNNELSTQGLATYQLTFDNSDLVPEVDAMLDRWNTRLNELPDIVSMQTQGTLEKEILIEVDPEALADENISTDQLIGVLNGEVSAVPPGEWKTDDYNYRVELETFTNLSDLETLPVGANAEGDIIQFGDVATINETFKPVTEQVAFEGEEAISLTFYLKSGASVTSAQTELDSFVDRMEAELPDGVEMTLLYTQADLVNELFRDLAISFAIAVVSVLIVCSLGLNVSTALSVALAIPVSLSLGAIILPFIGVDLNQISLIAFIIALGILVDDGIVVNENIERRLRMGDKPMEAAINGTKEVAVSVLTSTLTVVFTFMPLLLLPGGAGGFIRPLPAVLIATMIASTLVALFLIPIYRTIREKTASPTTRTERKPAGFLGGTFDKAAGFYGNRMMRGVTKRPLLVVITGFLLGTAAYALIPFIPLEFFPDTDREEVFVEVTLPEGTGLSATEEQAREIEAWLYDVDHVRSVSTYVGTDIPRLFGAGRGGAAGENAANFLVFIDREQFSTRETMNEWNETMPDAFPEASNINVSMIESGPPVGAPIAIEVSGEEFDTLREMADEVKEILASTEGVASVDDDVGEDVETIQVTPDRDALEENGVASDDLATALRLVGEGLPLGQLQQPGELIDMRMVYANTGPLSVDVLDEITVEGITGERLAVSDLVTVDEVTTEPRIPHANTVPTITVRAYPSDRSSDEILADARADLDAVTADNAAYSLSIGGETSARTDVFIDIGQIFIVVVFLILIVIAIQFYSLTLPILILSTVYLAIAGALIGLFLTQTGLGFMSMMGAVSLAGIVVRNGIVLIEFIEQRRKDGMDAREAVMMAAKQRFRPIVLTSLTSIAGLLPIALGNSTLFKPLGIAIVSGLIFSTLLTLFIVPALYLLQSNARQRIRARRERRAV
ncbi:putative multi-drug efflux system, acriflavin AcrB like protein [Alkalihalophilus pseudofirmus OF4]|uniref:Multi-drug efflux system, acriflavin AcrB like protein n=1 Tax=Alkalihalophilus pseudofirmus (strain ATCC BAA-2126 / JCM 17055 / OF4) TaxID=398511 RepID=D3FZJ9_ALKPO|nr:efflux RND transporter permease subunit [Alkalihalophilus pseudofirmus]ADC49241.1 putative multi-drug efflux system, acriflavin AcrB like protein [Alkalihalophilus pseudofirmus OF4]